MQQRVKELESLGIEYDAKERIESVISLRVLVQSIDASGFSHRASITVWQIRY
jgi:hypothetical protein